MIPKGALPAFLKYDLRVLRPQCYHCNINLGGNGAIFIELMREREGNTYVDQILKDRQITTNAYDHYTKTLEEYRKIQSDLSTDYSCKPHKECIQCVHAQRKDNNGQG